MRTAIASGAGFAATTDPFGNPAGNMTVSGIGKTGTPHNRVIPACAIAHPGDDTNNCATYTEAEGVRQTSITANGAVATTTDEFVLVVFDAPNGAMEKSWLGDTTFDIDGDKAVFKIPFNERVEMPLASANIRRVGFKPTAICQIVVEGV